MSRAYRTLALALIATSIAGSGCTSTDETREGPPSLVTISAGPMNPRGSTETPGSVVPVLQLRINADKAADLTVRSMKLPVSGNPAVVQALRLYRDANSNGTVEVTDSLLKGAAGPGADGAVLFENFTDRFGADATYLIVAEIKADAKTGEKFALSLPNAEALNIVAGAEGTKIAVLVEAAPITGGDITVGNVGSVTLAVGAENPLPSREAPSASNIPVLQFVTNVPTGAGNAVKITGVTVTGSGTGDEATAVKGARLYRDDNRNGVLDEGSDAPVGAAGKFEANDGTVAFKDLAETLRPGESLSFLVVYDLSGTGATGQTLTCGIATNDGLVAVDATSGVPVKVLGAPIFGGAKTLDAAGGVTLAPGLSNPGDTNEPQGATDVAMMQLAVTTSAEQAARLGGLILRGSGSGNESTGVASVRLFRDTNGNGVVDAESDPQLGSAQTFAQDDGTVTFADLGQAIAANTTAHLLVVYTFAGAVAPGQKFRVAVTANNAVSALDPTSQLPLVVSGAPVSGGEKTISTSGSLTVFTGVSNPGPTSESTNATDVSMLQFTLGASAVESVRVTGVTVRASGNGNDETGIGGVRLFRDVNSNGQVDSGDTQLGASSTYPADNGTVTFGALTQIVPAGARLDYLVIYDFSGTAFAGQTFAASIQNGAAVTAVGATSGGAIVPGGSAGGPAKTMQTTGALSIAAGVENPGPTNENANATGVPMLQFTATASTAENLKITGVSVRASGSGNDVTGVLKVRLFRDTDSNGLLGGTDAQLGSDATFFTDNGIAQFAGFNEAIAAGQRTDYLVVYDFAGTAFAGQTFAASITSGAAITVAGVTSGGAIVAGGSAGGNAKTIQTMGGLTILTGVENPGPTNENGNARDVSMLQFTLTASTAENVKVSAMTVRASGSGNDKTAVERVRLFRDVDSDGQLTPVTDVQIGLHQTFNADNGTATFANLTELVLAGARLDYIVVYDFAGTAFAGQTFAAAIATGAAVTATGVTSLGAIIPGGSAGGNGKTIQTMGSLTILAGVETPGPTNEATNAPDVSMLQFTLTSSTAENVKVTAMTVRASGSGNDKTGITKVRLFRDVDSDGQLTPDTDVQIGGDQTFNADNGTATFANLNELVSAGNRIDYVVVYDFAGTAFAGQTFAAAIATGAAVSATGTTSNGPIIPGGAAGGNAKTIQTMGALTILTGVENPGPTNEATNAPDVSMLQFTLTAATAENVKVSSMTVRASGSGNDKTGVSKVRLFRDTDSDGHLTPGTDVQIGGDQTFNADNGTATFAGLTELVLAGARLDYIVVYDYAGTAFAGQTFAAAIATGAAITATGATSNGAIVPGGAAGGNGKTIQTMGSLTILTGVENPGPTNEATNAIDVSMLQFTLTAATAENVKVSSMTVRASGSGNDKTGVAKVRLFRDTDSDGQLTPDSDVQIGGDQAFNADNGTATFAGLTELVLAGARLDYIVVFDFAGTAFAGQTFAAAIATGAAITATGTTSNGAIVPGGAAGGNGKTIQTMGSLSILAGVSNPGPTNEAADARDLSMLQFTAAASTAENVKITAITVRASGSANDETDVTRVRLFRDLDDDGQLTAGVDTQLGSPQKFNGDNGTATFGNLTHVVAAGKRDSFIVLYDLAGTAFAGQNFAASIATGAAVLAEGITSAGPIVPGGSAGGNAKTVQTMGSLVISTGVQTSGATNESAAATNVPMLQFSLAASTAEDVRVTSMTIRASGSGHDTTAISKVRLYRDTDSNGELGASDVKLGADGRFASDNGTATFTGFTETISAGSRLDYVVVYDFAGTAFTGQTFAASVATGAAIVARGVRSGGTIVPGGSAGGSAKTIQSASLTVALGTSNPGPSTETPAATDVPMLQFKLSAGVGDDLAITQVSVGAGGTANDPLAVGSVRLYRDVNTNGRFDAGTDVALGTPAAFAADNGQATFAALNELIASGATVNYVVVFDLAGGGSPGQTLTANVTANASIAAVSRATGQAAAVTGAPVVGAVKTLSSSFNTWSATSTIGAPSARMNHAAVSNGSRMFVWGGENDTGVLGDGASYDPASDVWTPLPSVNAPSARTGHVAAWVGGRMVIWGGFDGAAFVNTGRRYDPAGSGTWTTTSTTNAPSARMNATVVVTSTEMIVWGGFDGTALATGARYNPATDTWTALATLNAPAGRYGHSAVWTGTQMLVFGGYNNAYLATGGRYDPATNLWSAMATPTTLLPVSNHAAVWTGAEMQVFGGFDGVDAYAYAAKYVPAQDSWYALPSAGAPSARSLHTAVFTGRSTIVWGGSYASAPLATGARLSSPIPQWSPVNPNAAPAARSGHSALWIGGRMVVWGGATASAYLNSGGRYLP